MASITGATLQEQIQKAISTHGVFKFKLINMVERHASDMPPQEVAADDRCAMGEWLYGGIDPSAHGTAYYQRVLELHKTFHHAAGEVAALASERRYTEAMEAMESTSTFKRTSDQLVQAMEAWSEAVVSGEASRPSEPAEEPAGAAPAGWWLDAPATLEAEAQQVAEEEALETAPAVAEQEEAEADAGATGESLQSEGALGEIGEAAEGEEEDAGAEELEAEEATHGAEAAEPESDGLNNIQDWFGLPKSTVEGDEEADDSPIG